MATKSITRKIAGFGGAFALLLAMIFFTGCETSQPKNSGTNSAPANVSGTDTIKKGELLTIIYADAPPPGLPPSEERVKDDGKITLILNQTFDAAGKNRGDLEREIHDRYVTNYFKNLTVTIKPQARFYYVDGEVIHGGEFEYKGRTTVLTAIASAGGVNNFAQEKKVRLTHSDNKTQIVNCIKARENPEIDPEVLPGDKIHVPRRW